MLAATTLALTLALQSTPTVIPPVDVSPNAAFGLGLAVSGSQLIVGSMTDGAFSFPGGSAQFFERSQATGEWAPGLRVRGTLGERIGFSVDVDGDVAVIGNESTTVAPVRVCERLPAGWSEIAALTYPGTGQGYPGLGVRFGEAVAVAAGIIVVGTPYANDGGGGITGAVYVFEKVGGQWTQVQRILPPAFSGPIPRGTAFGRRLSFDGDTLVVGAPEPSGLVPSNSGFVSVWRRSGGQFALEQNLLSPGLPGAFRFGGYGLGVTGDLLAVGSIGTSVNGVGDAGMVHTYRRSGTTWSELQRLPDPDPTTRGAFGQSLAIDGDRLVVGRSGYFRRVQSLRPIVVESYVRDASSGAWTLDSTLDDPHEGYLTGFGARLVLDGDVLFAGAPSALVGDAARGAVYEASLASGWRPISEVACGGGPCSCEPVEPWFGCGNSTRRFGSLSASGSPSISADDLGFSAYQLPPNVIAQVVLGPGFATPSALGDGTLCIQAPRQLAPRAVDAGGFIGIPEGVVGRAAAQLGAAGQILAGETWVFQLMYGEPAQLFRCGTSLDSGFANGLWNGRPYLPQRGFNLTNALSVTFVP